MSESSSSAVGDARAVILSRVREALRRPAPLPHGVTIDGVSDEGGHAVDPSADRRLTILPAQAARPWLPDGGDSSEERIAVLSENLSRLRAGFERVVSVDDACSRIIDLIVQRDWRRVAGHRHPLVDPVLDRIESLSGRTILRFGPQSSEGDGQAFDKDALESCDLGITACEAIVSQTGSVLVGSMSSGGRSLSVLPHAHVVIATVDQVVPTIADAFDVARSRCEGRLPSMLSFITGPSRTGDIERILVLGAHGPRELVVVLVG